MFTRAERYQEQAIKSRQLDRPEQSADGPLTGIVICVLTIVRDLWLAPIWLLPELEFWYLMQRNRGGALRIVDGVAVELCQHHTVFVEDGLVASIRDYWPVGRHKAQNL